MGGRVLVANAPVSYGAFELSVGLNPCVPDGLTVMDHVAASGYAGIDLGPVGYLGTRATLGVRLAKRGLHLCGGYLPLPFSEPAGLQSALPLLTGVLDLFEAAWEAAPGPLKPVVTLADAGSAERDARPALAAHDRSLGLDAAGWRCFADGLNLILERCAERGFPAAFHHHMGTYVEAPWEIEEVLDRTAAGLCLDTGHFLLGGGEPVDALRDWGSRITHVHLKDVHRATVAQIVAERAPVREVWRRRAFCPLGQGDLDVEGVLEWVGGSGYAGWVVVEQDVLPVSGDSLGEAIRDQAVNRAFLRERGL